MNYLKNKQQITVKMQKLIDQGVAEGVFCGAQAAISINMKNPILCFSGKTQYEQGYNINNDTLFDIASLTKVFTFTAVLKFIDQGLLHFDDKLKDICPALFLKSAIYDVNILQLLRHEAGIVAWKPFFKQIRQNSDDTMSMCGCDQIVKMAIETEPVYLPEEKSVYSDLGFIILGKILCELTGKKLNTVINEEVIEPLKLESVHFRSLCQKTPPFANQKTSQLTNIAATEKCPWRKRLLIGEVHDDNAWAMGGIAGHAGLFAVAKDVVMLGLEWLKNLYNNGLLSKKLAQNSIVAGNFGRAIGFDLKSETNSTVGQFAGANTFGHLGFTGCSLWIDPDKKVCVALLSNRVHPSRDNQKIRAFRPYFHDELFKLLTTQKQ